MTSQSPYRTAIVGLGHIAQVHIAALSEHPAFSLIALCDKNPQAAVGLADDTVSFYEDAASLLAQEQPDITIIATSNDTHYPLACTALQAGCHIMVEKPVVQSLDEIAALSVMAQDQGKIFYSAFHAARAKEVLWFRQYLADHPLGTLTAFECRFYDPYIRNGTLQPGALSLQNCWMDSGVNALSVLAQFIDLQALAFDKIEAERAPALPCRISQARAFFAGENARGWIDTNWSLKRNYKETKLTFSDTEDAVLLNHSAQTVSLIDKTGHETVLIDFSNDGERLINHYRGVFGDFESFLNARRHNTETSQTIHALLFAANAAI